MRYPTKLSPVQCGSVEIGMILEYQEQWPKTLYYTDSRTRVAVSKDFETVDEMMTWMNANGFKELQWGISSVDPPKTYTTTPI